MFRKVCSRSRVFSNDYAAAIRTQQSATRRTWSWSLSRKTRISFFILRIWFSFWTKRCSGTFGRTHYWNHGSSRSNHAIFAGASCPPIQSAVQVFLDAASDSFYQRRQSGLKSGGRRSGLKNFTFLRKIPKNFDFFRQFHKQKIDFSRPISEKFRFFSCNSDFQGKLLKNFYF